MTDKTLIEKINTMIELNDLQKLIVTDTIRQHESQAKVSGWQKMDTAPYDGSLILVCDNYGAITIMQWTPSGWCGDPSIFLGRGREGVYILKATSPKYRAISSWVFCGVKYINAEEKI